MKMTMKNTIKEIAEFLGKASANKSVKADKNLFDRMKYTSSAIKKGEKIAKKDLLDLANDCLTVMAAAESKPEAAEKPVEKKQDSKKPPKKESSLKKKPSKGKATDEPKSEKAEEPKKESKEQDKPKAEPKAKDSKKEADKPKEEPKEVKFSFPKSFKDEDDALYERADDLETYEQVLEAVQKDEELVVAAHWSEELLKKADYGGHQLPKSKCPRRFNMDMDLLTVVYVGELNKNVMTVSMYTEVVYNFAGQFFKKSRKDGAGKKAAYLDFEIYRVKEG